MLELLKCLKRVNKSSLPPPPPHHHINGDTRGNSYRRLYMQMTRF